MAASVMSTPMPSPGMQAMRCMLVTEWMCDGILVVVVAVGSEICSSKDQKVRLIEIGMAIYYSAGGGVLSRSDDDSRLMMSYTVGMSRLPEILSPRRT